METRIWPFKAEHALAIQDMDVGPEVGRVAFSEEYLRMVEKIGTGYTLFVGEEIVGSAVFMPLFWPKKAEVVLFVSRKAIERNPVSTLRVCRKNLMDTIKRGGWNRVQALVRADSKRDVKFGKALGFKQESILEAFGPDDEDYMRLVIVDRGA